MKKWLMMLTVAIVSLMSVVVQGNAENSGSKTADSIKKMAVLSSLGIGDPRIRGMLKK